MRSRHGAGQRYLIQHSAGSGKSNSIAWLAHQLIGLAEGRRAGLRLDHRRHRPAHPRPADPRHDQAVRPGGRDRRPRRALGRPAQVHRRGARRSSSPRCRSSRSSSTRSAASTAGARFAIIIDEAHSSQGGRTSAAVAMALSAAGAEEDDETARGQDQPPHGGARSCCPTPATSPSPPRPRTRRWRSSASPSRRRTGTVKHRPFHSYTMKQAIQEGFILDVLKHYTPVESYYKLVKKVEGDPEFDTKRAQEEAAPLRREPRPRHPAQGRDHGGPLPRAGAGARTRSAAQARAMVVTSGIERAIQYFHAIRDYLDGAQEPATRPSSPSRASTSTAARR